MTRGAGRRRIWSVAAKRSARPKASVARRDAPVAPPVSDELEALRATVERHAAEIERLRAELAVTRAAAADDPDLASDQWLMGGWLRSIATEAMRDAKSEAWPFVRDAWYRNEAPTDAAKLRTARAILGRDRGQSPRPMPVELPSILRNLARLDPAFDRLLPETLGRVLGGDADLRLGRGKSTRRGQAGWMDVLARLAIECGAFGCEAEPSRAARPYKQDKARNALIERWKKAMERDPDRWPPREASEPERDS